MKLFILTPEHTEKFFFGDDSSTDVTQRPAGRLQKGSPWYQCPISWICTTLCNRFTFDKETLHQLDSTRWLNPLSYNIYKTAVLLVIRIEDSWIRKIIEWRWRKHLELIMSTVGCHEPGAFTNIVKSTTKEFPVNCQQWRKQQVQLHSTTIPIDEI